MAVTGSINMSGILYSDIVKKLNAPATAGTEGQVLGLNNSLNPVWMDQTGGVEIDDTAGAGDTDKTFSADKLTADHNSLLNAINNKISEPQTEGTNGQVLTTDGNGGRSWTTVQGGGGTSDYTDLTNKPQINGVTLTGNKSLTDIGAVSYTEEELLRSEMLGTSTTVTMDSNGNPTSIVHTANSATVRTDTFVWGTGTVTETRTLANGKYITIVTNLETLAQTISAVQEVA